MTQRGALHPQEHVSGNVLMFAHSPLHLSLNYSFFDVSTLKRLVIASTVELLVVCFSDDVFEVNL